MKKHIPIVMSTDKNYLPICGTAIKSLLDNASKDNLYKIYILYTCLSDEDKGRVFSLQNENSSISFIDVSEFMEIIPNEKSVHLSIAAIFRLFIPDILSEYDKVVYLDIDAVYETDVAKLYDIDLQGNILGAATEAYTDDVAKHWQKNLNMDPSLAFNTGVLIIDCCKFREAHIKEKCLDLLQEDWKRNKRKYIWLDQCVLNVTCCGRVKYIDISWNCQWQYQDMFRTGKFIRMEQEYRLALKMPRIIHFASNSKPWIYPEAALADRFWHYARRTIFYEELLVKMWREQLKLHQKDCSLYTIREVKKLDGKQWILYGAGNVGRTMMRQLACSLYSMPILWVDKKYNLLRQKGMDVSNPEKITKVYFDYILLAIEDFSLAATIKTELVEKGIAAGKIIWRSPLKDDT